MRIAIGSDHAGYILKEDLVLYLQKLGIEVVDYGTDSLESVDYPDFAALVGKAVQKGEVDRGILICGSGVGVCIAANKINGVYAATCHDAYSAGQGVEHDGMNVLCLGGRVVGVDLARLLVKKFVKAEYLGQKPNGDRFERRVKKIKAIETEVNKHE